MIRDAIIAFVWLVIALLLFYPLARAQAQEHHAQHHPYYQNWVNQNDLGCCNNLDCAPLAAENERVTAAGVTEVKIEGEWCPVKPHHYLKKGNAPDWSTSHVCVATNVASTIGPCHRLLCYQPRPGS